MKPCIVTFPSTNYPPLALPRHENLANHLTVQNSPILFGCRTGICGTCISLIEGEISPPTPEEQEVLELLAPANTQVRLACQVDLTNDIAITPYKEE